MNKLSLTWENVDFLAKILAKEINSYCNEYIDFITFSNGGLWTVAAISKFLNFKPNVYSWNKFNDGMPSCIEMLSVERWNSSPCAIVIDDILDSGQTAKFAHEEFAYFYPNSNQGMDYYFLLDKQVPNRIFTPFKYYAAQYVHKDVWVEFPWENKIV